ncbi:MAG: MFS transporter, partial [Chloroflexota bacterium]|nr:MFS transporter [Chloroflexota bacterium]
AWWVALLFAEQGIAYYLLIAWMPAVYEDAGLSAGQIAALYATFNAATLPAILGFPTLSDRLGARRPAALIASILFVGGAIGLAVAPLADPWRWLWAATLGAGVAGVFAITLVLPAEIAPRGRTGAVAGMVLAVGYAGSALGPVIAGVVRDVTGSFATALAMMPLLGLGMVALSLIVPELPKTRRH